MIGNIILWVSVIWLPALLWVLLRNETKFKKNIAMGVTIPYVGRDNGEVKVLLSRFRKELGWICLALTLIGIPGFFLRDYVLSFTLWCIWIDLVILVSFVPYVKCNRALRKLKVGRGWNQQGANRVTIDTSAIVEERWLSPLLFLPTVAIALLPLIWDRKMALIYLIFALCCLSFWFGYRWLYRRKAELVDENSDLTKALSHIRRRNWGKIWLFMAWSFGVLSVLLSLTMTKTSLLLLWMGLYLVVTMVVVTRLEMATRKMQEKLTRESGTGWHVDEDDKWLGGLIYYDPNDSRTIINSRVGLNSSVNLARPGGKILYGAVVLILLAMPFTGLFLKNVENSPLALTLTAEELVSDKFTIPLEEIVETELVEELPVDLVRIMGTSLPNLLTGNFSCEAYGRVKLCLDPAAGPYLLVKTHTDIYILGSRENSQIEELYLILQ